jgi:hypothetical protein
MTNKAIVTSEKKAPTKSNRLITPVGKTTDTIITKDWVGVELDILSVEETMTQYGRAYIAQVKPSGSKSKPVSCLIGASVLVKTLALHIENGGGFPITVKAVKPRGVRYFVFGE